jgi:hypothetical protein
MVSQFFFYTLESNSQVLLNKNKLHPSKHIDSIELSRSQQHQHQHLQYNYSINARVI